jgi:hypothetical protein
MKSRPLVVGILVAVALVIAFLVLYLIPELFQILKKLHGR